MLAFAIILNTFLVQEVHEKMEVRLVELDVHVVNLLHESVNGLNRDHFTVKENGKVRPIEHFEEISYLDMEPGEAYDSPRVLLLFNFMDDPIKVTRYIDKVEEYLLYKETGAWQVAIGYIAREGIQMVSPFTHEQTHWIEGVLATREAYRSWNDRTLYTIANVKNKDDVSSRWSGNYGFVPNPEAQTSNAEDVTANPGFGLDPFDVTEEQFAEKESPAMELDPRALSRFVRMLTAYDGIKEVLVVGPELWSFNEEPEEHWVVASLPEFSRPSSLAAYSTSNRSGDLASIQDETGFDLQEMLTNCVKSKIRLNRLETVSRIDDSLVSASGGSTYSCNINGIHEAIDRFFARAGHMYRLRYSTEMAMNDSRYRRVSVGVKGLQLVTQHVNRYYPTLMAERNDLDSELSVMQDKLLFRYGLPWQSLRYERSGDEMRAQLAVSQKIYLDHRLVFENVRVFHPKKPAKVDKGSTNLTGDNLNIEFDLPVYEEGNYRVVFTSVDLVNGAKSQQTVSIEL